MAMEIQLISIIVQDDNIQENYADIFSVSLPYLPDPKTRKRRRPKKKKETVAQLIDKIIDSIEQ